MLTENLSTLKINRLTQEQYDREKASGTLDDTALYFTPEEKITVPTSLSQLSDDETHRLVTDVDKTAWSAKYDKPSSGIPKTDLASAVQTSLVPSSLSSDAGKILTVNSSGDAVWAEATSSGSSGAESFLVTFTQDVETETYSADKTFAEIMAAYEAGKIVRCSVSSDSSTLLGELVSANTGYVCFGVEMLNEGVMTGISVYAITSDDIVEWNFLNFYMPRFFLDTLNASEWTDGEYSGFDTRYPSSLFDIEIELDSTATNEQLEAWSNAKLTSVFPTNKIKALGDVPTVNIPVIVKLIFSLKTHGPSGPK